jgi:hypothetical protein
LLNVFVQLANKRGFTKKKKMLTAEQATQWQSSSRNTILHFRKSYKRGWVNKSHYVLLTRHCHSWWSRRSSNHRLSTFLTTKGTYKFIVQYRVLSRVIDSIRAISSIISMYRFKSIGIEYYLDLSMKIV